jgi:hypothetical protein
MTARTKRKKKMPKGERTFLAIVYALVVAATLVFIYFFITDVIRKHNLLNNGMRVSGIVDAKDIHYMHAKTGTFTRRSIDYHFQTVESDEWISRQEVPVTNNEYEKLSKGGKIELRYDAKDPSENVPVTALTHISPTYSMILILAGVIGSILLYSYMFKKLGKRFFDAKSKNGWIGFLKFLVQLLLVFCCVFAGGFTAGIVIRGLNLLLFSS